MDDSTAQRASAAPVGGERAFYHSFPRRGRGTSDEVAKGLKILALICDAGLILAPEKMQWSHPHANGAPPREQETIQRRICFTELAPNELAAHAEAFGRFAIEFDIDTLKRLGAMPVFYIPRPTEPGEEGVTTLGATLVVQAIDAMILAMRIAGVKKLLDDPNFTGQTIDCEFGFRQETKKNFTLNAAETRKVLEGLTYVITPPEMLEQALTALLSCFYPADNLKDNKALAYYRQREWRIAWNFAAKGGEDALRLPSDEVVTRLLDIDADFFGRDFPTPSGPRQLAREVFVFPGLAGKRVIEFASRVIVPKEALAQAKGIVARFAPKVPVMALDEVR